MGYTGLDNFSDSDNASDLAYNVIEGMSKILEKGLAEKSNEFNTSGPINVALFFEAYVLPVADEYCNNTDLIKLAKKAKLALEKIRSKSVKADWQGDFSGQQEHIRAFKWATRTHTGFQ